jgi:hypothetical protein
VKSQESPFLDFFDRLYRIIDFLQAEKFMNCDRKLKYLIRI